MGDGVEQMAPTAEASVLSDDDAGLVDGEPVFRDSRRALAVGVIAPPDFGLQVGEGERPAVVAVEAVERGAVAFVGLDPIGGGLFVRGERQRGPCVEAVFVG